jgi:hypothetical protein
VKPIQCSLAAKSWILFVVVCLPLFLFETSVKAESSCVSGSLPNSHVFTRWDGNNQIPGGGIIVDGPDTECSPKIGQFDTIKVVQYWESSEYRQQVYTQSDGRPLGSLATHFLWRSSPGAKPIISKKSRAVCTNSNSNKRAVIGIKPGKCEVLLTIVVKEKVVASSNKFCQSPIQLEPKNCGSFLRSGQKVTAKLVLNFSK